MTTQNISYCYRDYKADGALMGFDFRTIMAQDGLLQAAKLATVASSAALRL